MREIKFRAWDKKRNVMIGSDYPKNWGNDKDEWYADIQMMDLVGIEGINNDQDFTVMQYTGLHDRNGREIYEGDIVELSDESRKMFDAVGSDGSGVAKRMQVGFSQGCWMCGRDPMDLDSLNTYLWILPTKDVEVIGNIYENPDLLVKPIK